MKKLITMLTILTLLAFPSSALAEAIQNLMNNSGGTLSSGALVVFDSSANSSFTTTTAVTDSAMFGVIPYYRGGSSRSIANGAEGPVQISGVVGMVCDEAMSRGDYVSSSTSAGQGTGDATEPLRYVGRVVQADASSPYIPLVLLNNQTKTYGIADFTEFVEVAKGGKEYLVIQTAIDSITDNATGKRYAVIIYPGEYTENVVMEEYVSLVGVGGHEVTKITSASGTTVTGPSGGGEAAIISLEIESTPTADGAIGLLHTTGELELYDSYLTMTSATADAEGTLVDLNGGGLHLFDCKLTYDFDGTGAGAATHYIFDVAGSATYNIMGSEVEFDVADVDDTVVGFNEASGSTAEIFVSDCRMELGLSHASYAGIAGMFYAHGTNISKEIMASHIHVTSSGGTGDTGYIFYMDTSAGGGVLNSIGNQGIITGFEFNYGVNVATGDTINAYFVALSAAQGATGAGTFNYISSTTAGALGLTGALTVGGVGTFTDDVTAPSGIFSKASFPASPDDGEIFYHTTHDTFFQYENSLWSPIINYSSLSVYADVGSGSDAIGQGYGTTTDATATVGYLIDNCVSVLAQGTITATLAGGTYTGNATLVGNVVRTNILIQGTLTSEDTGTADASTTSTLEDATKGWTPSDYVGKLVIITGGTGSGQERFILDNDANTLNIGGLWDTAPDITSTYSINTLATIWDPASGSALTINGVQGVKIKYIDFNTGTYGISSLNDAEYIVTSCEFDSQTFNGINAVRSKATVNSCYFNSCEKRGLFVTNIAEAWVEGCWFYNCNTDGTNDCGALVVKNNSVVSTCSYSLFDGNHIADADAVGVFNYLNSTIFMTGVGADLNKFINFSQAGCYGIRSEIGGKIQNATAQTWGAGGEANDTDQAAVAAEFALHT